MNPDRLTEIEALADAASMLKQIREQQEMLTAARAETEFARGQRDRWHQLAIEQAEKLDALEASRQIEDEPDGAQREEHGRHNQIVSSHASIIRHIWDDGKQYYEHGSQWVCSRC